ncbi:MAG: galactosyltransferase-related protein [Polyangia bacterium]
MLSLVTACMNREAHLRQSLPQWLALTNVGEVLVVDWSNSKSLVDLTSLDPRVRVIRVEDEPRWILSYAYNLGIALSRYEHILKCDADCIPGQAVQEIQPDGNTFYAGYWKSGRAVGKPSVNGQCVLSKQQFAKTNGYSEVIRAYGRDDEDFYDRLVRAGFARREISPSGFNFLDHTDEDRMANQAGHGESPPLQGFLQRNLTFNEMRNYFIGRQMHWGPWFLRATYERRAAGERFEVLRRNRSLEIPVPAALTEAATLFALRYLVGTALQLPATVSEKLEERACLALLAEKLREGGGKEG